MKKFLMVAMLMVALAVPCQADNFRRAVIASTTLDDSPTVATSSAVSVAGVEGVGFLIVTDETDSGNDTSGAITLEYSYDDTTWLTGIGFYNAKAPLTVVTSITTNTGASTDENIMILLDNKVTPPFVRVKVTITGGAAGADDKIIVTGYAFG